MEDARIFDLPETVPPILVSAYGPKAAELAAKQGDGLWSTGIREEIIGAYRESGGDGQIWSQLTVAWDPDLEEAVTRAHRIWPNTALAGQLASDLRTVLNFEEAVTMVSPEDVAESVMCGPDPEPVIESMINARQAGIDHVYLHQIGDPLGGFLDWWREEIRPAL